MTRWWRDVRIQNFFWESFASHTMTKSQQIFILECKSVREIRYELIIDEHFLFFFAWRNKHEKKLFYVRLNAVDNDCWALKNRENRCELNCFWCSSFWKEWSLNHASDIFLINFSQLLLWTHLDRFPIFIFNHKVSDRRDGRWKADNMNKHLCLQE